LLNNNISTSSLLKIVLGSVERRPLVHSFLVPDE
jgi:hypothetical protein